MKQTLLAVLVVLTALLAAAQDQPQTVTKTFADIADTNIRGNGGNNNTSYNGITLEITNKSSFYALLAFEYDLPAGMKVSEAKLHFVTQVLNTGEGKVYAYGNDFAENTTYANEESFVTAAFNSSGIADLVLNGENSKYITTCGQDYQDLTKWQNSIDVTDYIKTLSPSVKRVNFLLDKGGNKNGIYTKEAVDADYKNDKGDFQIPEWITDKSVLKPYLEVTYVEDLDNVTSMILPVADTWIRSDNNNNHYENSENLEVAYWTSGEGETQQTNQFFGLMEFELPADIFNTQSYEVKSVNLRIVHRGNQGQKKIGLYAYEPGFNENSTYAQIGESVKAAVNPDNKITDYTAKGQGDKAMTDGGLNDEFKTVEGWTNNIDLTNHIKTMVNAKAAPSNLAFVLAKEEPDGSKKSCKILTKESGDIKNVNGDANITFAKEDVWPLLTVSYAKKDNSTGIQTVEVEMENAPVEYYNLNGVKVSGDNMAPGIYVRRQGTKTTKILVK